MKNSRVDSPFGILEQLTNLPKAGTDIPAAKQSSKQKTRQHLQQILSATPLRPAQQADGVFGVSEDAPIEQLVATYTQGVKPLQQDSVVVSKPVKNPNAAIKRQAAVQNTTETSVAFSEYNVAISTVNSEAVLSYKDPTLQNRIFTQLQLGELRWYMALDMHGCTVEEARSALLELLEAAATEGQTVVKITHGKGPQAVLKSHVNLWLKQHPQVMAFHSCIAAQGGTGAVLVLLKRAG